MGVDMAEYDFKPDFDKWYKKRSVTKEDFILVVLGVEPSLYKKYIEVREKKERTSDGIFFQNEYESYEARLGIHVQIGDAFKELNRLPWNGKKDAFIKEAYKNRAKIHPDMCSYLKSINKMPNIPALEQYKNHAQYKANLREWELSDISGEDTALALLLGLAPEFFSKYLALHHRNKKEERAADGLASFSSFEPYEKWLFSEYLIFMDEEFPRVDLRSHLIAFGCGAAKKLNLWTGDFSTYVQGLYDNGFIFRLETFEALKQQGIELAYSSDSWAIQFYERFLRQGTWSLEEAASLNLGSDPHGEREFVCFVNAALGGSGAGLALDTPETIAEYDEDDNHIQAPDRAIRENVKPINDKGPAIIDQLYSLEGFVRRHIDAGDLKPVRDDGIGKLYFKPKDIITFFRDYLPRTYPAKALFSVLGMECIEAPISIKIDSSQKGKVEQFYKSWTARKVWGFSDAVAVYCGYDPKRERYVQKNFFTPIQDGYISIRFKTPKDNRDETYIREGVNHSLYTLTLR